MSRNLEWVYRSNGRELNTTGLSVSLADAKELLFDGEYVWVSDGTDGIAIYQYAGENSFNEPEWTTLTDRDYQRFDYGDERKLRLVTIIKVTTTQVQRSTILKDKSVLPGLLPTDPDGAYTGTASTPCTVTTVNGEQVITTLLSRVDGFSTAFNATHMTKSTTKVYVTNGVPFSQVFVFDIATQQLEAVMHFTEVLDGDTVDRLMNSNILFADSKLWCVASRYDDQTPQKVVSVTIPGGVVSDINLTARPGTTKSWLANGFNNHIYVSNFNNLSVSKISYGGTLVSTIRVNSSPLYVYGFPDKRIYVSSFAGMLSLIDWDDDGVHNDWGTESYALSLDIDPTDTSRIWFCRSGAVVRQELNTQDQIEITLEDDDWVFGGRVGSYVFEATASIKRGDTYQLQGKLQSNVIYNLDKKLHRDLVITNNARSVTLVENSDYTVSDDGLSISFSATAPNLTASPQTLRISYFHEAFTPRYSLVTAQRTYSSTEGTITVKPHLFFLSANCLFCIRLEDRLTWMPIDTEVNGQGAVAGGVRTEFGD